MGDQMAYLVACDPTSEVSRSYLGKYNERGIPCAFLIDRNGQVVFHGHPSVLERELSVVASAPAASAPTAAAVAMAVAPPTTAQAPAPTHEHQRLSLSAVAYCEPRLFPAKEPAPPVIFGRLKPALEAQKLPEADVKAIENLATIVAATAPTLEQLAPLIKAVDQLPDAAVFPAIDLLRISTCSSPVAAGAVLQSDILLRLFTRFCNASAAKAPLLLTLRLACNVFLQGAPVGPYMVKHAEAFSEAVVHSLTHADVAVRIAAASLGYNLSLWLVGMALSPAVETLLVSLCGALDAQVATKPTDETVYVMLMAIGHMIYCNTPAVEMVKTLLASASLDICQKQTGDWAKISQIASEVKLLLG
jgi:hypothetical protein